MNLKNLNWKKKLASTFLVFSILALIPSCGIFCNDSCGCSPDFPEQSARIKSFEILTFSTGNQQVPPSLAQPYDQIVKAFRIKDFDLLSLQERENYLGSGFGLALACSPPPIYSEKKLVDVKIINLKEVQLANGSIWETGQNISSQFVMTNFFSTDFQEISAFIGEGYNLTLDEFFKIRLNKDPGKDLNLELNFSLVLEGGQEFIIPMELWNIKTKN